MSGARDERLGDDMASEYFDVIVIGAGLSGIDAGVHLQKQCPDKTFVILEGRERLGGTWDLFRYPGIRSDSDMYTLGYAFKPWVDDKAIADGGTILAYLNEAARDYGVDRKIRFSYRVVAASWSSAQAEWTLDVAHGDAIVQLRCGFVLACAGYYKYENGYTPDFPGVARFKGRIVHPQFWTPDIDYAGKRVVVIGSGATAVTLVPEMAKTAAHVTMAQRTPTYMVSLPARDGFARALRRFLPDGAAYAATRWKNVALSSLFYKFCRARPQAARRRLIALIREKLGPDYDVERHFSPPYNPWEQRLCVVPDNDFFDALKAGKASIVTDTIAHFTETGLAFESGATLEADLIVTATGLELQALGGALVRVDGAPFDPGKALYYKGAMFSGLPNLAAVFGYVNASWTLKADLICDYVCRLLKTMDAKGARIVTPAAGDAQAASEAWVDFSSGYFQRAAGKFPMQGTQAPWRLNQNYLIDIYTMRRSPIEDGALAFSNPPAPVGDQAA